MMYLVSAARRWNPGPRGRCSCTVWAGAISSAGCKEFGAGAPHTVSTWENKSEHFSSFDISAHGVSSQASGDLRQRYSDFSPNKVHIQRSLHLPHDVPAMASIIFAQIVPRPSRVESKLGSLLSLSELAAPTRAERECCRRKRGPNYVAVHVTFVKHDVSRLLENKGGVFSSLQFHFVQVGYLHHNRPSAAWCLLLGDHESSTTSV
jgi:hypothetical protein